VCPGSTEKRALSSSKKKKGKASTSVPSPSISPPAPPVVNAGPAYERKKQRAKDAGLKSNDSIERRVDCDVAGWNTIPNSVPLFMQTPKLARLWRNAPKQRNRPKNGTDLALSGLRLHPFSI
jgi:hypothetical protein